MSRFFKKEQVGNGIYDADGNQVMFQPLSGDAGVIELADDSPLVAVLSALAGRMGVSEITRERYEDLKKKRPLSASEPRLQRLNVPEFRVFQPSAASPAPKLAPVAAPAVPVGDLVADVLRDKATVQAEPPTDFKPKRGRPRKTPQPAAT